MICVGIDVAKDKHDCFILSSEGVALADVFTIPIASFRIHDKKGGEDKGRRARRRTQAG